MPNQKLPDLKALSDADLMALYQATFAELENRFIKAHQAMIGIKAQSAILSALTAVPKAKKPRAPFTLPPKYRHPTSGVTWAGTGTKPGWVKEAYRVKPKPAKRK